MYYEPSEGSSDHVTLNKNNMWTDNISLDPGVTINSDDVVYFREEMSGDGYYRELQNGESWADIVQSKDYPTEGANSENEIENAKNNVNIADNVVGVYAAGNHYYAVSKAIKDDGTGSAVTFITPATKYR